MIYARVSEDELDGFLKRPDVVGVKRVTRSSVPNQFLVVYAHQHSFTGQCGTCYDCAAIGPTTPEEDKVLASHT
jgi:hypothetical protein